MAEKERGRLHTNSLDDISICWMNPLLWRMRDLSDSEYVSLRESSIFDSGVPLSLPAFLERRVRCCMRDDDGNLLFFFDFVPRSLPLLLLPPPCLFPDLSSSSDDSEG